MNSRETYYKWPWLNPRLRSTRWSLVARVQKASTTGTTDAANEFCQCYWYPLYSFLRASGYPATDAQDHVQSFLLHLFEADLLGNAGQGKGRLRNFLLTLLKRHISNRQRWDNAQKRGGGTISIPLDWAAAEPAFQQLCQDSSSPDDAFRRGLAARLVAEGIAALRRHYAASGQEALCEDLLPALEGSLPDDTFEAVAARHGLRAGTVRATAFRMRERFRLAVRDSAAPLLQMPAGSPGLDAELRDIFCGRNLPSGL